MPDPISPANPSLASTPALPHGWATIEGTRKWHFFRDGKSLCGGWAYFGRNSLELGNDASEENCAACRRKVAKRYPNGSQAPK